MADTPSAVVPTLDTPRLRLRPYRPEDAPEVFALYSDPRVVRYWSFPAWNSPAQATAYIERALTEMAAGRTLPWAVARREDDRVVGTATLFFLYPEQGRAELGFSLRPELHGQGYASEGVRAVLAHAFDTMGLRRVEADVDPRNAPSRRVLERVGFREEGLLRARWQVAGETCDSAFYGLLAGEFRRVPAPRADAAEPEAAQA
jgi:RimJ/RimL family protein N-acetyltransferase